MKRTRAIAFTLGAAAWFAAPVHAALWGRDRIEPVYGDKPAAAEPFEEAGLEFQAANDDSYLYLTISAHEAGARRMLTGEAGSAVSLIFMNGKKRDWGIRLRFGGPAPDGKAAAALPVPEQLAFSTAGVSSAALNPGVRFSGDLAGRKPVYELAVPLSSLKTEKGRVMFDFEASRPTQPSGPGRTKTAGAARAGERRGFRADPLRDEAAPETMLGERMQRAGDWQGGINGLQGNVRSRAFAGAPSERTEAYEEEGGVYLRLSVVPASKP